MKYPLVPLDEVLVLDDQYIEEPEPRSYPKLSVKLYGKGVVVDAPVDGATLRMRRHQIAKAGQVILSEIWGKKGAIGFVPPEGAGALCTSHFFLFSIRRGKVDPGYLQAILTANYLQEQLESGARGTTGYAAVRPKHLLAATVPLPPLPEQRRIVGRIERVLGRIEEVERIRVAECDDIDRLMSSAYRAIIRNATTQPLEEVAPLTRRPVVVDRNTSYPQVAVRSFGKGTFHKPPLHGDEITWQKPFLVRAGDILISNIKAWEGAIAVATEADDGRVGSHRYLTCVPKVGVSTPGFVSFHLLTPNGLSAVGSASPGSADRNRTLSAKKLMQIPVPVPPYEEQRRFDVLAARCRNLQAQQSEVSVELAAVLQAILHRAFKGQL